MKKRFLAATTLTILLNHSHCAPAMDCAKEKQHYSNALCHSTNFVNADKAMNAAFAKVVAERNTKDKETLRLDQRAWLQSIEHWLAEPSQLDRSTIYDLREKLALRTSAILAARNNVAQEVADKLNQVLKPGSIIQEGLDYHSLGFLPLGEAKSFKLEQNQDWSKLVENSKDAATIKYSEPDYEKSYSLTADGRVVIDFVQSGGTMQCSSHHYLIETVAKSNRFRLFVPGIDDVCAMGGEGSSGSADVWIYNQRLMFVVERQDGSDTIIDFMDMDDWTMASSELTIKGHLTLERGNDSSCEEAGKCFSPSEASTLFKDYYADDAAPLLADANGKKLEGLRGDLAIKAKTIAMPALIGAWFQRTCPERCDSNLLEKIPEPIVVDLDGKGQLAVIISARDDFDNSFFETLLIAKDETGEWSDKNSIKIIDIGKDLSGYDFSGPIMGGDADATFYGGVGLQLRKNAQSELRILRFGKGDYGVENKICCYVHELKLDGNKLSLVQRLELNPQITFDSIAVSAVGVAQAKDN
jgi:uncharacterized protein YecT (DUF1311 family)